MREPRRRKRKLVPCPDRARWRDNLICARRLPVQDNARKKERKGERETKSEGGHCERGKRSIQKDRPSEVCACVRAFAGAWERTGTRAGDQRDETGPTVQSRKQGTALTWLQPPRVTGVSLPLHSRSPGSLSGGPLGDGVFQPPASFPRIDTQPQTSTKIFAQRLSPFLLSMDGWSARDLYLYRLCLNQFRSLLWSWDVLSVAGELLRRSLGISRCIPARETILQRCAGSCFCVGTRSLFVARRFPVLLLYEDYTRARNTGGFLITSSETTLPPSPWNPRLEILRRFSRAEKVN